MNAKEQAERWHECLRKRPFLTWQDAERSLRSLQAKAGSDHRLNTYRCRFCTAFHVGHVPASVKL